MTIKYRAQQYLHIGLLLLSFQIISVTAYDLNIMLIVSFGQFGFNSSGVIPAADIALEDINSDPDVLPGYNLTYDRVRDSQVCMHVHLILSAV